MTDAVDPFEAIKVVFFQECDELLGDLEAGLLAIEGGDTDLETVNAVFRAVHSVKGGAGAFGLEDLVRFAHVFETLLDEVRAGRKTCDDTMVKTLLRASDVLSDHIAAARGQADPVDEARSAGLVAELEALTRGDVYVAPAAPAPMMDGPVMAALPVDGLPAMDEANDGNANAVAAEVPFEPVPMMPGLPEADEFGFRPVAFDLKALDTLPPPAVASGWRVVFRPKGRMYAHANEAGLMLRELGRLGQATVTLDASELPDLEAMSAEEGYLAWTVDIVGASESDVRDVFDFVGSDCDTTFTALADVAASAEAAPAFDIAALLARAQAEVAAPMTLEPIVSMAVAPSAAGAAPAATTATPRPAAAPATPSASLSASPSVTAASAAPTIRVDLDRVDRLINVVGELVIQQAMLAQRVVESGLARSSGISVGLEDLELLTREIQDSVMAIRAQPVKSVFQRMPRLVREVAEMTGKRVRLVTAGEDTEVDKTVVERLAEPITHMLRNAIDHGLEGPDDRVAAGKPAEGTVRLAALHRSGRIVIEISDDGRGINRERVRGIAVSRGLIAEDASLSDEEVDNLIFLPGFSTADTVSDISGRGVGMDVVRRSIQALGGRITIASVPGKGSVFTLSLPLTLAVMDGMVVSAAEQTLVAPLTAIVESLLPRAADVHYVGGHDAVITFREKFVPLIDVAQVMGFRADPVPPSTGVAVIVETEAGVRAALLFDAIQGQRQVVIKSLETNYQQVPGIAAATILGDGRVALILDVDALVTNARRKPARADLKMAS
ncbi:chemotaxis protein CheA [Brevundimonas variabilis]|uniref:Chemotaxis protein CheA n=1 Tax=Brevundimonas variabilis TaxID=74312 RepID=A0A7W9FHQ8_9CAUL|nr:chemotaxis protein CheA [Brevundimonas variabilis]MBB5747704.1 two-component system chemotaxis sensor kinase CheA [Brevundimonas variabilis]